MSAPADGPRFVHLEPCDWDEDGRCGATPTAWAGDIYYACEDHIEAMCDWLEDAR